MRNQEALCNLTGDIGSIGSERAMLTRLDGCDLLRPNGHFGHGGGPDPAQVRVVDIVRHDSWLHEQVQPRERIGHQFAWQTRSLLRGDDVVSAYADNLSRGLLENLAHAPRRGDPKLVCVEKEHPVGIRLYVTS